MTIVFYQHYRDEEYIQSVTRSSVIPIHVSLPLSRDPLIHLLRITKKCLDNNFISCFLAVAGTVILLHYESILEVQDECPLLLCYSTEPGTGYIYFHM